MDRATLVTAEFGTGAKVLEILDRSGLAVSVAMWLYAPEYEDWRFVLSSRRLDNLPPSEAYGFVHDALEQAGFPLERTPPLLILRMTDPFIRTLRHRFGKGKSVEGMRLGGQMIGGRFIEDALVYRIQ
jgi:hypothetical protein